MFVHGICLMKCLTEIRFVTIIPSFSFPSSKHLPYSTVSPPPSEPDLDDPIVTTAVSILRHHPSKARWNHVLSTAPVGGFTPSQFSQIIQRLRKKPHLVLRFFQFTLQRSLCAHTVSSYATIIHVLARFGYESQAQDIIQTTFRKFPSDPNSSGLHPIFETLVKTYKACDSAPLVFDLLLMACIETKRVDQAVEIVRMLRCKNLYPKIGTCNALIELVVKSQGSFAAFDVYREIFRLGDETVIANRTRKKVVTPNAHTFNAFMVGFYREALVQKVEEVWVEMARVKCKPNAYSYSIMMAVCCDDGRMEDATRLWEEMENKGVKPDAVTYNTMIGGFCSCGDIEKAEEFSHKMIMSGLENTCTTFEHLIKGNCKDGNVDSTMLLYKDMVSKGFRPENSTADAIINMLCDINKIFRALEFLRFARKKHGYDPSKKIYELLIEALCVEGKLDEALRVQVDMVGKGYAPDSKIYDAFIDGYINQGNEEMAEKLKRESLNLGFSTGKT